MRTQAEEDKSLHDHVKSTQLLCRETCTDWILPGTVNCIFSEIVKEDHHRRDRDGPFIHHSSLVATKEVVRAKTGL